MSIRIIMVIIVGEGSAGKFHAFIITYQSVGRRSMYVGTARVKSHVIRVQNASKLGEKA